MTDPDRQPRDARWRKEFAGHVATYHVIESVERFGRIECLYWGKPGTGIHSLRMILARGVLTVFGDLYDAVYSWGSDVNLHSIAEFSLDYFAGKCRASPVGRDFKEWRADACAARFTEEVRRLRVEEPDRVIDQNLIDDAERILADGDRHEWSTWMRESGPQVFGDDWWDWVPSFGVEVAWECEVHLLAIKLATAQWREALAA